MSPLGEVIVRKQHNYSAGMCLDRLRQAGSYHTIRLHCYKECLGKGSRSARKMDVGFVILCTRAVCQVGNNDLD